MNGSSTSFSKSSKKSSPNQKVLLGLLEGLPLYGEDLVERWRARVRAYPEPLRRAMIERYWDFFPVWHYREAMTVRDAELWRLDVVLEAAFNLLGVLAGLNRLYFTRFQLKHTREFVAQMAFAPPDLVERLESLLRVEPERASAELERLIEEIRALVARTGLSMSSYELFGTFSDPTRIVSYPDGNIVRSVAFAYRVGVVSFSGLRASPESEELRFFPKSELLALDLPATQRPVVERLLSGTPPPHLE